LFFWGRGVKSQAGVHPDRSQGATRGEAQGAVWPSPEANCHEFGKKRKEKERARWIGQTGQKAKKKKKKIKG